MTELEEVQLKTDFRQWWNKAVIALQALKMIVKNPLVKITIQYIITLGNAYYNTLK